MTGSINDLDPIELGEAGSLFLTRPRLADHMEDAATVQRRADAVFGAIRDGALRIEVAARYTLAGVDQGLALMEARRQIGESIVSIDEDLAV